MLKFNLEFKGTSLVVRVEEPGTRRIPYLDTLKAEKGVDLLIKLHLKANVGRSLDTLSFQEIAIPAAYAVEVIRSLGERLFFRGQRIKIGKSEIFWRGKGDTFEAFFLSEKPLSAAISVLPGWLILDEQWLEVESSVSWQWIEKFLKGPLTLEGSQRKRFLEEEPTIFFEEQTPFLKLTDSTGCFATCAEKWEKDLLEVGYVRKNGSYYCPSEKVKAALSLLLEVGWICEDSRGRNILLQSGCKIDVSEKGNAIAVRATVQFGEKEGSFRESQKSKLFLDLDHTSVGLLDHVPQFDGVWEGEDCVQIAKHRIGEVLPLIETATFSEGLKKFSRGEVEPLSLSQFQGTLLPYQEKGVQWLYNLRKWGYGALLSDEMGLGKTVQVLAFFSSLRTNLPILIVAPTSLLFNWQREIERFWKGAHLYIHTGQNRAKEIHNQTIILTSYALLRIDQELFSSLEFEAIALDESQAIKNHSSQANNVACQLKARFKIAITGTPVENRPEELWAQFRFILPELLGERVEFQRSPSETIRRKIKPFILRRRKSDVQIDLPEKVDHPLWVEMSEGQQTLYDQTLEGFKKGLLKKVQADGMQAHRMEVLEVILRLRQIACDARLVGGEGSAKSEMVQLWAEEIEREGKKALIFSQFTSFLKLLEKDLLAQGITPLYLDGSTPAEERGLLVARFQEEPGPHLFLLSLKAGGVGLNLTAAESVFLLDPWWNDAVERQAIDRAHRIGQKKTLFVHRLLTPHSIEEKMLKIKAQKADFAEALLSNEAAPEDNLLDLLT